MLNRKCCGAAWVLVATLGLTTEVRAQIPVTDVGAILQMIQQLMTMEQQLTSLENQLQQAKAAYAAITGPRGMEQLLSGTVRNYLPSDWQTMMSVLQSGSAQYQSLSAALQQLIAGNAYLSNAALAGFTPGIQSEIAGARQSVATTQLIAQQALSTTSDRFASLQQLIGAIPTATDEKGALDLQARIQAELGMLQNEQIKVDVMLKAAQAQDWVRRQQNDEKALGSLGSLRALPPMGL